MIKVLCLFKSPATYTSDLFKFFCKESDIDLFVMYCLRTTDGTYYIDNDGKRKYWGTNVLSGFKNDFLTKKINKNISKDFKIINPNIYRFILRNNFDVVLLGTSYWSITTWIAILAAHYKKIPILTRTTVETSKKRNLFLLLIKRLVVGLYCKSINAGVYECQSQKDYLLNYGMKKEQLFYSPCSVNNEYFQQLANKLNKEDLRIKYGIKINKILLVTTGQIIERKRPLDLVEAFKILLKKGYDISLCFVGDGPLREKIDQLEDKYKKNIIVTGNQPINIVAEYLKMSDIFLLASENDASPKSLNEAMNFSLPIVVSNGVCTIPELLEEEVNGYSYNIGDYFSMAEKIEKIILNNKFHVFGEKSLEIINSNGYFQAINGWKKAIYYSLNI